MKKFNLLLTSLLLPFLILSCDQNPCDEGYTQLDGGVCIPDYVVGIEQNSDLGNTFYHSEFGLITLKNGDWYDHNNSIIKTFNK